MYPYLLIWFRNSKFVIGYCDISFFTSFTLHTAMQYYTLHSCFLFMSSCLKILYASHVIGTGVILRSSVRLLFFFSQTANRSSLLVQFENNTMTFRSKILFSGFRLFFFFFFHRIEGRKVTGIEKGVKGKKKKKKRKWNCRRKMHQKNVIQGFIVR